MKLIDKDALLAEINKRIIDAPVNNISHQRVWAYNDVKDIVNTLEVKDVDLDNIAAVEWDNYVRKIDGERDRAYMLIERNQYINLAKHFIELGLLINNPFTAADRGTAEEIIINLKRVEKDYHINLTKEIEWLIDKAQKGE